MQVGLRETVAGISDERFAASMTPLGPFEPRPCLAVAVSGGPDSMALALLASRWTAARGGSVLALVVDHGLRPQAAAEASLTRERLAGLGIGARVLAPGMEHGSRLAERARQARYAALEAACAEAGIVHLLLGHHAGDQAETLAMRRLAGSGPDGMAGMAALVETARVRLLRPLLPVAKAELRATLRAADVAWIEDPSNTNPAWLRARLRLASADPDGISPETAHATEAAALAGKIRAAAEAARATVLAERIRFSPLGYALMTPGPIDPGALAAVVRTVAGRDYTPPTRQVAALAGSPHAATLAGVRIAPAGRLLPSGWLLAREPAAMARPVRAATGAVWDGRFRLAACSDDPAVTLGALGDALRMDGMPALVSRSLPALWRGDTLVSVPHLAYPNALTAASYPLWLQPALPSSGAPHLPASPPGASGWHGGMPWGMPTQD